MFKADQCFTEHSHLHGDVSGRLLYAKMTRSVLLAANATVTICRMDWNTVRPTHFFLIFSLSIKSLFDNYNFTGCQAHSFK